jgi:hypothetical protein
MEIQRRVGETMKHELKQKIGRKSEELHQRKRRQGYRLDSVFVFAGVLRDLSQFEFRRSKTSPIYTLGTSWIVRGVTRYHFVYGIHIARDRASISSIKGHQELYSRTCGHKAGVKRNARNRA